MIAIPGYNIFEVVSMNGETALLRAEKVNGGKRLLLKVPISENTDPIVLSEINNEHFVRSYLETDMVLPIREKLSFGSTFFLEMDNYDGVPLSAYLLRRVPLVADSLKIAVQLTSILEFLHAHEILHRDVRPQSFLIEPQSLTIVLSDLRFARKFDHLPAKNFLDRKLSIAPEYLAPEQSGRMDLDDDLRSDLYALGITLYQIFTRELPFQQVDINELVHAHLAKEPHFPGSIEPELPSMISEIILKLLQKKPDDRYQSAQALRHDLLECLRQFTTDERIERFSPCQHEVTESFKIASCIYGRDEELSKIENAYASINSKSEFIWLSGCSGIGKSTMVREVARRLQAQNILFLHGKCDQTNQHTPYSVFVQALNPLVKEWKIANGNSDMYAGMAAIKAQSPSIGIVADIIADLRFVLGEQSVPSLPPVEAQNRLALGLLNFITCIATPEQPLLLFLDDLQWADEASLNFVHLLIESETKHMLIIGASREMIDRQQNESTGTQKEIKTIHLPPLTLQHVSELLADTLGSHPSLTRDLADHLMMRTLGSPLFVHEQIQKIHKEGLFNFNPTLRRWDWSLEKIKERSCIGSSLELIVFKIQRLPKTKQQTLIYAACIGQHFELFTLAALLDKTEQEVAEELKDAIHENLITLERNGTTTKTGLPKISYRFLHDQVQQAACSLITPNEKQEILLSIGYFLLERLSSEELENRIFEIISYFNGALSLIESRSEKLAIAKLNLQAGEKSKYATAYKVAHDYFQIGLRLIDAPAWQSDYKTCFSLHRHGAETAYLNHQFDQADKLLESALQHTTSRTEKVSLQQVRIQSLVYQQKNKAAVLLGLEVLHALGVKIPKSNLLANVLLAYLKSKWTLRNRKPEDLAQLPRMENVDMLSAMNVLQSITASAYHAMPDMYPLLILKMFSLSFRYGNSAESSLAYATYGAIANGIETSNSLCYRFGRVAVNLLGHFEDVAIKQRTLLIFNLINRPSGEDLHGSLEQLKQCYKQGIELGDLEYSVYTSNAYCMMLCISGKNLSWVKEEMLRVNYAPAALNPGDKTNDNEALIQYVSNLLDENGDTPNLDGPYFNELSGFASITKASQASKLFTCYIFKINLSLLLNDYNAGLKAIAQAKRYGRSSHGVVLMPMFYFYASLLHFMAYDKTGESKHLRHGRSFKNKLKKWADQVPVNFMHRYLLTEAEYCRVCGTQAIALEFYDRAIKSAQENQFVQDEALAHECLARYWRERGQNYIAQVCNSSALEAYKKWGCTLKVRLLTHDEKQVSVSMDSLNAPSVVNANNPTSLDLATILKASTALSSEVVFDKLLEKLMKFVIENAGAQAGYFIIDWGGKLIIEARQSVNDSKSVKLKLPVNETELVPRAIIEHVFHSRNDVVLHDARSNNPFSDDPAIVKAQVRSALCIPALNQGKLVGVLYLENNLMSGAFTKDRVALLKLLSGQIAVSIENSILYENLEQKVQERTAEIQVQKEEIQRQKQLVEEKSHFKEQFFANMSHEIRTPMTAIIGMSELIFDTPLNEKQHEYAKGIKYSSENLLSIINDILDYAKIEAGKFSFVNKPFQIRDRITRLSYIVKQLADEKGISVKITIDPSIPEQLIGDPIRLHQILLNLASNAVKFTERGTVAITIAQVSANERNVTLSFIVSDTGVGIAAEKLGFIFETFSRIEDELSVPGTGLGLFIAKKLVEEQGGEMSVSSKIKEGTAFKFTLAFQRSRILVEDEDNQDDVALSGTKILLVEDTLFNQVVAEEILKKIIHNPQVIIAENGKVALDKLEQYAVDIILMDIKMPVMDGYAASREIRARGAHMATPILAFTSNASPGESEKCTAAGMNDYITKPIESKKLKQKISRLLVPKDQDCSFL